jgi:hypothetical protein
MYPTKYSTHSKLKVMSAKLKERKHKKLRMLIPQNEI